jgi:uncharacterized protein YdgA (DUF945 family)
VDYQFDLSNRHLKAGPMALDDLHFGLRVHGLDLNVLTTKRADDESCESPLVPLFEALMISGASLELQDFSTSVGGNKFRVTGAFSMPGVKMNDFANAGHALDKIDARLSLELPTAALRDFVRQSLQSASKTDQQALEKEVGNVYAYILGKMITDGYARLEKDKLLSTIELKHSQVRFNGNPETIPLSKLISMLEQLESDQSEPPEQQDHTPPSA